MKYSTTHPSTDPKEAMNAYSGIRVGCSIDNSISSKSLIIGNVSTEESRKEIRKSPGAPSPLANATTFCFNPLRVDGTRYSSRQHMFLVPRTALALPADSCKAGKCRYHAERRELAERQLLR